MGKSQVRPDDEIADAVTGKEVGQVNGVTWHIVEDSGRHRDLMFARPLTGQAKKPIQQESAHGVAVRVGVSSAQFKTTAAEQLQQPLPLRFGWVRFQPPFQLPESFHRPDEIWVGIGESDGLGNCAAHLFCDLRRRRSEADVQMAHRSNVDEDGGRGTRDGIGDWFGETVKEAEQVKSSQHRWVTTTEILRLRVLLPMTTTMTLVGGASALNKSFADGNEGEQVSEGTFAHRFVVAVQLLQLKTCFRQLAPQILLAEKVTDRVG